MSLTIWQQLIWNDAKNSGMLRNAFCLAKVASVWAMLNCLSTFQWRHNGRDGIPNNSLSITSQLCIQVEIKENIKAPHHWPLCEEFTNHRWVSRKYGQ